jgi:hypothetical protein
MEASKNIRQAAKGPFIFLGTVLAYLAFEVLALTGLLFLYAKVSPELLEDMFVALEADDYVSFISASLVPVVYPAVILGELFLIAPVLIREHRKGRKVASRIPAEQALWIMFGAILFNIFVEVVYEILPDSLFAASSYTSISEAMGMQAGTGMLSFLAELVAVGIIAPVTEELIFRYIGIKALERFGTKAAVIITAVSFGLMHGNMVQIPYALVAGLILGWLFIKYEHNLMPCLIFHITVNASSVISEHAPGLYAVLALGLILGYCAVIAGRAVGCSHRME